jgi:7,8-dihydro-6-hydroxymethylpterin-pyrophosphokinase
MKKQMLTMLSVFLLGSSIAGGSVFAGETIKATALTAAEPLEFDIEEDYYENLKEYVNKEAKAENKAEAIKLLNEIEKLEKAEKFDDASKLWEKFDKLLPEADMVDDYDFYKEMKDHINKEVKAENKKEALNLLTELEKLETAEKFDEADKVWDKLVKIVPSYATTCTVDGDFDEDMDGDFDGGDYYEDMKDYINEEVKAENKVEALKILTEMEKLEKAEKYDEADKVWEKLDKLLPQMDFEDIDGDFDEEGDFSDISDEDFYKELKTIIEKDAKDSTSKEKALKLLSEIQNLEKEEKYDDADKKWEALEKLVPAVEMEDME